jgi:hypothetical protein
LAERRQDETMIKDNMTHTLDTIKISDEPEVIRGKWKEIKGRYTEVLKAKNIQFDEGMGPLLDKRAAQWKKIHTWMDRKLPDIELVKAIGRSAMKSVLQTLISNANELHTVATNYRNRIHGHLGDPAERALTAALDEILSDAEHDRTVGENLLRAYDR